MKRTFFNILTTLSLLLCLSLAALWIRGYFTADSLSVNHAVLDAATLTDRALGFTSQSGRLSVQWHRWETPRKSVPDSYLNTRYRPGLTFRRYQFSSSFRIIFDLGFPFPSRVVADLPGLTIKTSKGPSYRYLDWESDLIQGWNVSVSPAPLVILTAVPPAIWVARRRRAARRRRRGQCIACGYDLTGNASGVCPECGTKRSR